MVVTMSYPFSQDWGTGNCSETMVVSLCDVVAALEIQQEMPSNEKHEMAQLCYIIQNPVQNLQNCDMEQLGFRAGQDGGNNPPSQYLQMTQEALVGGYPLDFGRDVLCMRSVDCCEP